MTPTQEDHTMTMHEALIGELEQESQATRPPHA